MPLFYSTLSLSSYSKNYFSQKSKTASKIFCNFAAAICPKHFCKEYGVPKPKWTATAHDVTNTDKSQLKTYEEFEDVCKKDYYGEDEGQVKMCLPYKQ